MTPKLIKKYQLREATETVTELRSHPAPIRYTLLAILFSHRHEEVIDYLADLLDEITLKFGNKAKNTTRKEAVEELERVQGKNKHIVNLLKATVDHPEGIIQDTLFPIVGADMIRDIIKDITKNNRVYKEKIYTKMHSSYQGHYRKSLSKILKPLLFAPIINFISRLLKPSNSFENMEKVGNVILLLGMRFLLKALFSPNGKTSLLRQTQKDRKSKSNKL